MRAPITDKHLLEMMWERFPEIMKRGAEQPARQGPVKGAALNKDGGVTLCKNGQEESIFGFAGRLFTSPPAQRTWVGLTDEEIQKEFHPLHATGLQFARAIEAKLKEKNNG